MSVRLCLICGLFASAAAALLLLAPSPAFAQATATLGGKLEDGAKARTVNLTVKMLGSDKPAGNFKLLAFAKFEGKPHENATFFTDEKGTAAVTLNREAKELRFFAYGDFVVPDGWSNVPPAELSKAEIAWTLFVRPLKNVRATGKVSVTGRESPPVRASVSFAPLDVGQDGSARMFDAPYTIHSREDGSYEFELPSGYYMVWCNWADRSGNDWVYYHKVVARVAAFDDVKLDLALVKAPQFSGKVIDARTGKGIGAQIDLYSNVYLRQLRNNASDGVLADEYDENDEPVVWPAGTFKFQAWAIDPSGFTAVIKPMGSEAVLKVIPNLKAADLDGKEVIWELYTDDMRKVNLRVTTHEQGIPVMGLDVRLMPKKIDVPEHLQQSYTAGGMVDENGFVHFLGLAAGTYDVYGASGSTHLGEVTVKAEAAQEVSLKWPIPFAYGTVKLADGSVCKNLHVFIWMVNPQGRQFGPYPVDAFKENAVLREKGMIFVPLLQHGFTFKLRFAAMDAGKAYTEKDWVRITDFPLVTDEVEFKIEGEKAHKVDLTLKANPDFKAPEKRD